MQKKKKRKKYTDLAMFLPESFIELPRQCATLDRIFTMLNNKLL